MTARRTQADKAAEKDTQKDDEKVAGRDESKTVETTDKAREDKENVPDKVEPAGETDVEGAASGGVAGGVPRGETGLDHSEYDGGLPKDRALGVVTEGGNDRASYDVPWTYLTPEDVNEDVKKPRTSDSDDGDVVAWNVQWASGEREGYEDEPVALTPVQGVPGQTFHPDELPNVEVMEAAGIDSANWLSGLPVRGDLGDKETHRRGTPA